VEVFVKLNIEPENGVDTFNGRASEIVPVEVIGLGDSEIPFPWVNELTLADATPGALSAPAINNINTLRRAFACPREPLREHVPKNMIKPPL
jgi:hypothetical protein